MIDDDTVDRLIEESDTPYDFARAIEQLARQEQREADARICEEHWEIDGTITAKEFASAIRASGKENSNEQSE